MSRIVNRAESFEKVYEAFQNINFNAFDFDTVKSSLIEYIKLYFPEAFNDFIESSEFIAILELFAYISEILAYRFDINAHENFISVAERKQSVLRLAKLISYNPTRNLPARGLVKINSITTTEQIFDSEGIELTNKTIIWNDINNPNWKEQFILVMNRVLQQEFGTVTPSERIQVDDVLFELYKWNNVPLSNGVFPYNAIVAGETIPMELVPTTLNQNGPLEKRPENNSSFSLLFGSDGLGDQSDTTGFFIFTKQGTLQKLSNTFDGVTPNQTFDIDKVNINDTDIYVNNIDANTKQILDDGTSAIGRSGEWVEVDLAHAQNIIFNTNSNRKKYEIETLENDKVRLVFGDGEFADIPSGAFEIWFRTSLNRDITILQNSIVEQQSAFTYVDVNNTVQTFQFSFSLINSLQNSAASEDIEHIRNVAPSVYYTQDRMVNSRDYNTFMLQDPSILKLHSINRTFAGDSKYIDWHDPKESYENVKIFGDDLAVYFQEFDEIGEGLSFTVNQPLSANEVLINNIQPLLSSVDFFNILSSKGMAFTDIRTTFEIEEPLSFAGLDTFDSALTEGTMISTALSQLVQFDMYYSIVYDEWTVDEHYFDQNAPFDADSFWMIRVIPVFSGSNLSGWDIIYNTKRIVVHSETTKFWNTNDGKSVITFDSLDSNKDTVVILKSNVDSSAEKILTEKINLDVLSSQLIEQNSPNSGLIDIHKLHVITDDTNGDGIPDNISMSELINLKVKVDITTSTSYPLTVNLPRTYIKDRDDELRVYVIPTGTTDTVELIKGVNWREYDPLFPPPINEFLLDTIDVLDVTIDSLGRTLIDGDVVVIEIKDYVYFFRESVVDDFVIVPNTEDNILSWLSDTTSIDDNRKYKRFNGRSELNFSWLHITPRFHLVDPSASNIIDTYIISKNFFTDNKNFLDGNTDIEPVPPLPVQLKNDYGHLLDNRMISDTMVLHAGKLKTIIGSKSIPELRAKLKIIRPSNGNLTDNEVKVRVVDVIRVFFDINLWEFGETFYFSELASAIHNELKFEIDSVVLVPTFAKNQFGDLYQISAREDEILQPHISVNDIEIIDNMNPINIQQNEV